MFANQSRFFIADLRRLGYLSELKDGEKSDKSEAEEAAIKMALRATMQAVMGGLMDGLGNGLGSLACGLIADAYSYMTLWHLFFILSLAAIIFQAIVEISRCRWSDAYKPPKGTKLYAIRKAADSPPNGANTHQEIQPDIKC